MTDHSASTGDDLAVELASRYLDGDLSSDERVTAEADPEVMAWVERFGDIQAALRAPLEVDDGVRDAAIAAALAAFGDESASEPAPPPGVGDLAAARARRAGRMARWLGAAAAVAAVAVGGAVLAGNSGGNDDSASDETELMSAAIEVAPAATEAGSDKQSAEDAARSSAAQAPTAAQDATAAPESAYEADAATTTAGGAENTTATGGAATDTTTAISETTAGAATTAAPISTEVASYATEADLQQLQDAQPVTVPAGTEPPCADAATGEPVAIGVLFADQPAVIYRDAQRHTITAWSADSCDRLGEYTYSEE